MDVIESTRGVHRLSGFGVPGLVPSMSFTGYRFAEMVLHPRDQPFIDGFIHHGLEIGGAVYWFCSKGPSWIPFWISVALS